MPQWVKMWEDDSGSAFAYLEIDFDPDFTNTIQEAWFYAELYISSDFTSGLANNQVSDQLIRDDSVFMGIVKRNTTDILWYVDISPGAQYEFGSVTPDTWYRVEWHHMANGASADSVEVRINQGIPEPAQTPVASSGLNFFAAQSPSFVDHTPNWWYGIDNMAVSVVDWVADGGTILYHWDFELADPINAANATYPTPPFSGEDSILLDVLTGAPGPGPGIPGAGGGGGNEGIDLSTIVYRAKQVGDYAIPANTPNITTGPVSINLDGIKYRAWQEGDVPF